MSKSNLNDGDFECIHSEERYCKTPENQEMTREESGNNSIETTEDRNLDNVGAGVSSNSESTWGILSMLSSFWLGSQYKVNIDIPAQQINNSIAYLQPLEDSTGQLDVASENELVENNLEDSTGQLDVASENELVENNPCDDKEVYTDAVAECLADGHCCYDGLCQGADGTCTRTGGANLEESTDVASENELVENNLEDCDYKEEDCFVIIANSQPVCYMSNIESARIKMRELAYMLSSGYMDHNVYIEQQTLDEIHVIGNYRYYILSHSRILERLCVHKVDRFTDDSCILNTVTNLLSYSPGIW